MKRQKSIRNRKLNNGGFSLIELIVVMAIMVVLGGTVVSIMGIMNGRQAKQCRDELFSKLDGVRTTTMGKRTATATLDKDGSAYVLRVSTTLNSSTPEIRTYRLDSSKVTMYYSVNADGSDRQVIAAPLTLEFDRASGAMKAQADGTYIRHIYAVQNGREYGMTLYPETGKIQKED